ncbi:BrnT family toxin [Planctomycetota bacterium]
MDFEWDSDKARLNLKKHCITFEEAATVFADPLSMTFPDPDHSHGEDRFVLIGKSFEGNILVIAHTERGKKIRIINARKATRKERKYYEEEN